MVTSQNNSNPEWDMLKVIIVGLLTYFGLIFLMELIAKQMKYLLILTTFFLAGCLTPKKAMLKLDSSGKGSEYCAIRFPVKTEYIKGDSVVSFDTIYQYVDAEPIFDTIYNVTRDTVFVTKQVPVTKYITKTVLRIDTVVKENTAALDVANKRINALEAENGLIRQANDMLQARLDKAKKQRNTAYWLILLAIAYLCRKPIIKLVRYWIGK